MRSWRLRRLMPSLASNPVSQFTNKVRRLFLCAFRPQYVERQEAARGGECVQCGKCCKLVFKCPFLGGTDDNPRCMVYEGRPKPCQAFPIDRRDLADVNFQCGYFFEDARAASDLVQIRIPELNPSFREHALSRPHTRLEQRLDPEPR